MNRDDARDPTHLDALREVGARELVLGGNEPFSLSRPFAAEPSARSPEAGGPGVWAVREGRVELFARQLDGEGREQNRLHLATLSAGHLLFGIGEGSDPELLAVAARETRLLNLGLGALPALARDPAWRSRLGGWIETWIDLLLGNLLPGPAPQHFEPLAAGAETDLAAASAEQPRVVRPARGLVWVRHVEGRCAFLGLEELPLTPRAYLLPLPGNAWLTCREPTRLSAVSSENLLASGALWEGFGHFHRLLLDLVRHTFAERARGEARRLADRLEHDRRAMEGAHLRLASVLGGAGASAAPPVGVEDPLLAACRRVAEAQGIELRIPPELPPELPLRHRLLAIADASRVRMRRVILRDTWWQDDDGPLLGYLSPGQDGGGGAPPRPVALLPTSPRRYEMVDPAKGERTPVDAAVAETLLGEADMFYPPLPERPLGILDLLRHALRGSRRDLGTVLAVGAGGGVLALLVPVLTGQIFGTVIPGADRSLLAQMTLALVVAALAGAGFQVLRGIAVLRLGGKVDSRLQPALWDRLLALPAEFFRGFSVGDLAQRAGGIEAIRETLVGHVSTSLLGAIFSLASFALLFYYSVPLALVAAGLVVLLLAVTGLLSYLQVREQRELLRIEGKVASLVLGLIQGIGKLRVGGAERRAYARWAERFTEQRRRAVRAWRLANIQLAFNAVYAVATSLALFAAVGLSLREGLPLSDFLAFNAAFGQFQAAALSIINVASSLLALVPLYERLSPILQAVPEVDPTKAPVGELRGEVELSHISFRYTADGPLILDDVSIRARPGEFIAVVGPSGSGKSTCLRLALGFEHPHAGSVYYDGQDLGSLDLASLRRQLGVVLQDSRLMAGDLFNNIIGAHNLSQHDAWEAAELAGIADDIRAMPMGMHTVVSESAGTFSGGQKQRVMIARAIVHRPRVLYFDEATSALDNRTQDHVARSLEGLKATRIVVAHRLSTIVGADRIYVLDKGRIVESGTYGELVARGGLFARLAARQVA